MDNSNLLNSVYVSCSEASRVLGVHRGRVRQLATEGFIATREIPGHHRTFRLADLLRLAESSVRQSHGMTLAG